MASIEKRVLKGQTSWRAHYRTPAGAQRNKTFSRKVEAERFLASVESAKVEGSYVDPARAQVTVGEWADRWLDVQTHLKPTTQARYAGIVRTHIRPKWGRVKLGNVAHSEVQTWVSDLAKGASPATVHKVHRVLSLILEMAVKGRAPRSQRRHRREPASTSKARASLPDPRTCRRSRDGHRIPTRSQQAQQHGHPG